jgi:3-deoxy-D-manno-octulosonic-acid transferase
MYWIYSFLLAVALLLTLPYWLLRMGRNGKYRDRLLERLGKVPERLLVRPPRPTIWIHAVSVGEVLAVGDLCTALRATYPEHRVLISTTTTTGQRLAGKRHGWENVFYFPLDLPFAVRKYLRVLKPELIVIAETEFWPNFLRMATNAGVQVAVANARISDRSWPGYRRLRFLLRKVLRNVDLFLVQTEEDARRLRDIGAPPERTRVTGNLKFDAPAPVAPAIVASLGLALQRTQGRPVIVCGSTVDGEEPLLLRAFENVRASYPSAVMILAPRHPERFEEVAILLQKLGIHSFKRSLWSGEPLAGGVLLVDTIGELASLYALADVAFVGGSLVPRGGHNILEPAQHGVPIMVGNHTENFRDIVNLFQSRDAIRIVGPAELPLVLLELLSNEEERKALGRRAIETVQSQKGATGRTLHLLKDLLAHKAQLPQAESSREALPTRAR